MRTSVVTACVLCALAGCSDSDDDEPSPSSQGGSGGAASATGGRASGGDPSSQGGTSTGGKTSGSAGSATGGKANAGSPGIGGEGGAGPGASGGTTAEAGTPGAEAGEPGTPSGGTAQGGAGSGTAGDPGMGTAGDTSFDGPGVFVAVGYGGRRVRSIDGGVTWIDDVAGTAKGGDDDWLLRAVAYGGGQFVAVGYRAATSPDGGEWTVSEPMDQWLGGLAYAKDGWVAAGGSGRRAVSTDGSTWRRPQGLNDVSAGAFRKLTYDASSGRWLALADGGGVYFTEDGALWEEGSGADFTEDDPGAIAAGGGVVVAIMRRQRSRSTDGGLTWEPASETGYTNDLAYSRSGFVALGIGRVSLSSDGVDWENVQFEGLEDAIACHDDTCVVVSRDQAFRSIDGGRTWEATQTFTTNTQPILAAAWGPVEVN